MQNPVLFRRVPALIDALDLGDEARLFELLDGAFPDLTPGFPPELETSLGLTLSVYCGEQPYSRFGEARLDTTEVWPEQIQSALTPDYYKECAAGAWPVPPIDPSAVAQVASDIPTLILVGEFDPITSVIEAERAAAGLANSGIVLIPAETHGVTERNRCAQSIMASFIASLETSLTEFCPQGEHRIVFDLGTAEQPTPVPLPAAGWLLLMGVGSLIGSKRPV